jgi:phage FluMu gp28-like protein
LESFEKWKEWAEAYKLAIEDINEERENPRNSESLIKSATITFPKGSRVIAVPGRPDTVRGFSANVLATEFAFFEDPDATWRALLPSITNPLRGGPKKCRLISTPNGIGNKFHDLWVKNFGVAGAKWSCHRVTITEAVAQGLPVDVEELRAALDDPEGWAQEYDPLDFLDLASVLLSYELLVGVENTDATEYAPAGFWETSSPGEIYLGIDFGRKRDLTVVWAIERVEGGFLLTREALPLRKMSTPDQVDIMRPRLRRARRCCLDYTGPGVGLGDYLVKEFGEYDPQGDKFGRVELCTFTQSLKQEIFPKLKMACESRKLGIPVSRAVREDLHSMNRVTLSGGGVTYRAPHTPDGHADYCVALALAIRAAATAGGGGITSTAGIILGATHPGRPVLKRCVMGRGRF